MTILPSYGLYDLTDELWYDPHLHTWRSAPFFPYVSLVQARAAFVHLSPPVPTARVHQFLLPSQPGHPYDQTISLPRIPNGIGD